MKKILILLVLVATSLLAQAQTRQLKVYLHSGVVDTLRMSSGSTIAHSRLNLQGERQDDYVTMIVTIGDSIWRYAIADLDSLVLPNGQRIIFRGSQVVQPVLARAVGDVTPDDVGDLTGQVIRQGLRRTSFSGTFPGSDIVTFYWTENDRIRLDVGDEARAEELSADKTEATFIFDGAELESGSYVVYYPDKIVTIATEQTQTGANNSDHIGDVGDCGTALAELQDDGTYGFTLKHQASYLCFLPHIDRMPSVRISKIVLSSSSAIAGDYQMSRAGLYNGTNTSQTITLNLNPQREKDFVIGHSLNTVQDTCAAYMVIAPQSASCNFTVTYYLTDTLSRITTTYQQSFSLQPVANTVYPINSNIPDDLFAVVDMGLSTKWSHANLSATEPSQAGDTYTFVGKNDPALTSTVVTQWATPTNLQMQELIDGCTWEPMVYNGVNGYLVTAKNPGYDGICHRLFLPNGTYWTSGVTSPDSTSRYSLTPSGSPALTASAVTSSLAIRPVEVLFVDMGLPGHTLWATHNIGATMPSMRGDYYAWGETETKNIYTSDTYDPLHDGTGAYDNLDTNIAGTEYDVARVKWGGAWRMPTTTDFNELNNNSNCQWTWTTISGQNGYLVKSKTTGNTIFLPAAGNRDGATRSNSNSYGFYYSSVPESATASRAYGLEFHSSGRNVTVSYGINFYRYYGLPIRPVITYTGTDLMVTSDSVQWKMGDTEAILHGTFASISPLSASVKVGFLVGDSLNLTHENADSIFTFTRSAKGTFSATMPVYNDFGYYWRAYVQDADTIILGDVMEYGIRIVDLGLSSGTRWRNMNVGASRVEEFGDYYAWGETETKNTYNSATYDPLHNGTGSYDNLDTNISGTQYDAARRNLGGYWRMPTKAEFEELRSNCKWQWVTINGQTGYRLISKINGNSIFLPAAGYRNGTSLSSTSSYGFYYSSVPEGATDSRAYGLEFHSSGSNVTVSYGINFYRYYGLPIRPVMTYTGSDLVVTSDSVEWKVGDTEAVLHGTFATLVPQTSDVKVGFLVGDSLNLTVANADSVITFTRSANGTFEATMPVYHDVGHYWRAYAQDADTTMLGDVLDYGVRMIDLGLSSGVLWRNMNVGASRIEERGDYYAWGEVETKDTYNYASYDPLKNGFSQYDNIGTEISGDETYDAARHNLGGYWRMPTKAEFDELNSNCTWQWKTINGQTGYKLTSKINGNSIFLPAAGYRNGTSLNSVGSYGYYYSSVPEGATSSRAWGLQFHSSTHNVSYSSPSSMYRYNGYSIRPVAIPGTELSTGARIDIETDTLTYVPGTDHVQFYGTLTKYNHWSDNMTVGFVIGDSATFTAATATDTVTTIVRNSGQYTLEAPYLGGDKWFRAVIFDGTNAVVGRAIHYGTTVTTDSASYRQGSLATTVTLYGKLTSDPKTLTQPVKVGFYIGKDKNVSRTTAIDSVKTTVDANGKFSLTIAARDTIVYYRAFVELNDTCRGYGVSRHYGFAFIDLGLPSGTWWANTDMGAASEITAGDYYAWGELQTKASDQFTQDNYAHYDSANGYYVDLGHDIAYSPYDAATHAFDGLTSLPSMAQYAELFKYCTAVKDTVDGQPISTRYVGPNGNSIILCSSAWTSTENALMFGYFGYPGGSALSSKYYNQCVRPVRRINAYDQNGVRLGVTADSAQWSATSTVATLYGSIHAAEAFSPVKVGFVVGADTAVTKATADTIMSKQVSAAGQFSLTYNYKSRPAYYRAFVELTDTTYYGTARRVGEAYIDLGLPSHTLWADMNVGSEEPSGLGYYITWGDTISTRRKFGSSEDCDTYDAEAHNWKDIGRDISNTKYDAARALSKGLWSMPTYTQWQELFSSSTLRADTLNSIVGYRVTGPNGKSIFIPAFCHYSTPTGYYSNYYWTANTIRSALGDPTSQYAYMSLSGNDVSTGFNTIPRFYGMPVRAAAVYTNITRDSTYLYISADSCDWTPASTTVHLYGTLRSQTPLTGATYGLLISRNNNPVVGGEGVTQLTTTENNGQLTATTTLVNDRYYYRPYITIGDTTYYGKERRYGYAMIDLGLPSHTLWADVNLGATTDDGYGDYYQFGETEPQLTTPFDDNTLSIHQPITDSLGVIAHYQYDAATVQLGGVWSTPTRSEIMELDRLCTSRPDTLNGTYGVRFTGPNGNSIFIPKAGMASGTYFPSYNGGNSLYIMSSNVNRGNISSFVWQKAYYSSIYAPYWNEYNRRLETDYTYNTYYGFPLRAVAHVSDTLSTSNKPVSAVLQKWMPKKAANGRDLLEARVYGVPVGKTISQMGIILGRDSLLTRDNGTVYTSQTTDFIVEPPAGVDQTNYYVTLVGCSYRTIVPHISSQTWCRPFFVVDGETYYGLPHTVGPRLVDLGLESGTLWADINVGSIEPGGEGEYYQWGELVPEDETTRVYSQGNYQYYNIFLGLDISRTEYDAASQKWGPMYAMPTDPQWNELLTSTTLRPDTVNGSYGMRFIGSNGNSIFMPYQGYRYDMSYNSYGYNSSYGYYWTSNQYGYDYNYGNNNYSYTRYFYGYGSSTGYHYRTDYSRYYGMPIRPVGKVSALLSDGTPLYMEPIRAELSPSGYQLTAVLSLPSGITATAVGFYVGDSENVNAETGTAIAATVVNDTISNTGYVPFDGNRRWFRPYAVIDNETVLGSAMEYGVLLVDMGLPSGTKWANMNLGATEETKSGNYYQWGETTPDDLKNNLAYGAGLYDPLGDGVGNPDDIGADISGTRFDAARVNWGNLWSMPSQEQFTELINNCAFQEVRNSNNNTIGYRAVSRLNGNSFFLPTAGYYYNSSSSPYQSTGSAYYWTSTVASPPNAYYFSGSTSPYAQSTYNRWYGLPVRPVARQNTALPDGTLVYVGGTGSHLHDGGYSFSGLVLNVPTAVTISSAGFVVGNDSLVTTEIGTTLTATLVNDTLTSTQTIADTGTKRWYRPFIVVGGQTVYGTAVKFGVVLVDLGLPSGTLWADANLGAEQPTDKGDYYLWGETTAPKLQPVTSAFTTSNYALYNSSTNNYIDVGTDISYTEYDAAYVNMGGLFAMPTAAQTKELVANCRFVPEKIDGVPGVWAVSRINDNRIFLPANSYWYNSSGAPYYYWDSGSPDLWYWTSSIPENNPGTYSSANVFNSEVPSGAASSTTAHGDYTYTRYYGLGIRPVAQYNTTALDGRRFYFKSDSVAVHGEVPETRLYALARGVTTSMTDVTYGFVVGTSTDVEIGPNAIGGAQSATMLSRGQFCTTLDDDYLDGLTVGTTYYARPFLTVGSETFYGEAMPVSNSLMARTDSTDWKQGATTVTFYGSTDGATASSTSIDYGFLLGDHADITAGGTGVRDIPATENDGVLTAQINDLSEGVHYYRAYAKVGTGYAYGIARRFGNGLVDLGLPSGTLWTTTNLGSQNDFTVDSLYAWGEKHVKTSYYLNTYDPLENGTGIYDNIGTDISHTTYDVAREKLGASYSIPTKALWEELINNCTFVRDTVENVVCYKVTSKVEGYTDRFIYLPMTSLWTATINGEATSQTAYYYYLSYYGSDNYHYVSDSYRYTGYGVRPVCQQNISTAGGDDMFLHADSASYNTTDITANLHGTVRGITPAMTDVVIGFVVGTTEGVEKTSAMTDGTFVSDATTDGTFSNVLPATFVDQLAAGVTYYARPYITIGGTETLYGNALAIRNTLTVNTDSTNWQYGIASTRLCGAVRGISASSTPTYGFVVGKNATIAVGDEGVTVIDNLTATDGVFKGTITTPEGVNYYRAFAVVDGRYVYGNARRFGLVLVDLGLRSGTLWSNIDLGAQSETENGSLYAWGETAPKATYDLSHYDPMGDGGSNYDNIGNDIQFSQYDAVNRNMGGLFAMPTESQWTELIYGCTMTNETVDGVSGYRFTNKTDATKSIFIASGMNRWSSVLYPNSNSSSYAYGGGTYISNYTVYQGYPVRPVYGGNVKLADETVLNVSTDSCDWRYGTAKVNVYGSIKGIVGEHELTYGFVIGNKADVTAETTGVQNVPATFSGNKLSAQVDNVFGKHYYRAYVKEGDNYFYGAAKSYGLEVVDLGLPSGTLWAAVNLGANTESDYGDKYAWGETHTKTTFSTSTYDPLGNGTGSYDDIGTNIQCTQYDAATATYGGVFAMPTLAQIRELYENCTMTYTNVNGVSGYLYTGMKKGYTNKSIFIPSSYIWTSEVSGSATNSSANYYYPGNSYTSTNSRYNGYYIRPVYNGNTQLSDGQRVNFMTNGRKRNADESLTLNGTLKGVTSGMTVSQVGFVISDAETVGVSTPADKTLTATLGADGTFTASLEAGFTDRYPEDGRVYMRAFATINGDTYYADAKSWYVSARDTTIASIKIKTSGKQEFDLSDCSEITIEHLYDNGGGTGTYDHNCDGYIKLIAAEGATWTISGTVSTESCCDYVSIFDGPTVPSIASSGYAQKIGGNNQSVNYPSGSNVIYIWFHSDSSVTGNGFDLQLKAE